MILPSKHLSPNRALLTIGARILEVLSGPKTVSTLWEELHHQTHDGKHFSSLPTYDSFVLALDLLFLVQAIIFEDGHISRVIL